MKKQIERTKTNLDFEREREIRSFQSKGKQFCQLRNQQGEAKRKQEGKPNCCETIIHVLYETQAIQVRTKENRTDRKGSAKLGSSSEQEHKVNALASGADEGRDKLR